MCGVAHSLWCMVRLAVQCSNVCAASHRGGMQGRVHVLGRMHYIWTLGARARQAWQKLLAVLSALMQKHAEYVVHVRQGSQLCCESSVPRGPHAYTLRGLCT